MADIAYRTADGDGRTVFYRESGEPDAPTLVLLQGFPSASHVFRELIPLPADRFHFVAPDLPGFGKWTCPCAVTSAASSSTSPTMSLLHPSDAFPELMLTVPGGTAVTVPVAFAG